MRILLIKTGALGDVLRATALLPPLRRRYPRLSLWWLTDRKARPLLTRNPDVERVIPAGRGAGPAIGKRPFDLVLSLEEDKACARLERSVRHGRWTGVVVRGGRLAFTPDSAPYYRMSLLNRSLRGSRADFLKKANRRTYEDIWLGILGLKGARKTSRPVLRLGASERAAARRWMSGLAPRRGPRIGIKPGAGGRWPSKGMPDSLALSLCRAVRARWGVPALLFGGPEERRANAVLSRRSGGDLIDVGTRHSLRRHAALVELCDGLITTDSLTLHAANALRRPVVALAGPTSRFEISPPRGWVLSPPGGCGCFYKRRCSRKESCLSSIDPRTVLAALSAAMRG